MNIKNYIKTKTVAVAASVMLVSTLTACGQSETYDGFVFPDQPESVLAAVSDTYVECVC